jgi:hypothetical protein
MVHARALVAACLLAAACDGRDAHVAPVASPLGPAPVINIGVGNALTLPAQRHLVRIGSTLLLAIQQDGADGNQLGMFRSDDDGQSFRRLGDIAQDPSDRDEADLVVVGQDIALVSSYEGPDLVGSTAHDVWFQWWRHRANGEWTPDPAVKVFDSTSGDTGYYRAELAVDSLGRYWIQAFFLRADGSSTSPLTVSSNGGASFSTQASLVTVPFRGGGRLLALGSKMIFLWDGHDVGTPAFFRLRNDSDGLGTWGAQTQAFAEGIYHGAALSAVGDGAGGMHLFYKDENLTLWYRKFNGTSFGGATLIEDVSEWELQPAVTRIGSDLVVYYNRVITTGFNDEVRVRTMHNGVFSNPTVLDSSGGFKGYPAAVEVLPTTVTSVPCLFGDTPDASTGGSATLYAIDWAGTPPPPPDMSVPPPDLSVPPDLSMPPPQDAGAPGATLFSDDFNRNIAPDNGLGANWTVQSGAWYDDGRAVADSDGGNRAVVPSVSCADCSVATSVISFGVSEVGVVARQLSASDAYELVLQGNGNLLLRRRRGGTLTTLASGASGASVSASARLSLSVSGSSPVSLSASVGGVVKLTASDGTAQAITGAGVAGLICSSAGVPFDDFAITALGGGMPPPPDMSVPRDLSVPPDLSAPRDLSVPPDLSAPRDLSMPPDLAVAHDLATGGGTLFSDAFARNIAPDNGLGNGWTVASGLWYTDGRAVTDSDAGDRANAPVSCADCRVQSSVTGFGVPEIGVFVRGAGTSRYELVLLSNGRLRLRRVNGATVTTLGEVASGLASLDQPATLLLDARGATLTASVNGAVKLTVIDATPLTASGSAGLVTSSAGVVFDDFSVAN